MVDCTDCGACCVDQAITLNALERSTTPPERMNGKGNMRMVDGHCIMFDPVTRRCTDYENRPTVCRDFKSGCGRCIVMRAFSDVKLGGAGAHPLRMPVRAGSYGEFARSLHIEKDVSGNMTAILHPDPDYPTARALETANRLLPSEGY